MWDEAKRIIRREAEQNGFHPDEAVGIAEEATIEEVDAVIHGAETFAIMNF